MAAVGAVDRNFPGAQVDAGLQLVVPVSLWYVPGAQAVQGAPAVAEYLPAAQAVHVFLSALRSYPASQVVQLF